MQTSKPACTDFVVATVRAIRPKSGNWAPGVATGVRVNLVWQIASELYSWEEFVSAINSLIRGSVCLMTAHNKATSPSFILRQIPDGLPPPDSWRWPVNKDGELTSDVNAYTSSVKLYVVEDGLPEVVQKILNPKKKQRVTARQIVDSMR